VKDGVRITIGKNTRLDQDNSRPLPYTTHPLTAATAPGQARVGSTTHKTAIHGNGGVGMRQARILLIDDNPPSTRMAELILRSNGFTNLHCVVSGNEAQPYIENSRHSSETTLDLIIIDMLTNDVDAIGLCKQLKTTDTPVLLVSPNVEWRDEALDAALKAGAQDIIFKPVYQHDLVPRVLTLVKLKKERETSFRKQRHLESELAERRIMEARLQYLVNHDDLTGLCNRKRLQQAVDVANLQADLNGRRSTLVYIDLNQFKVINELEGHDAGDRLLTTIANILRKHSGANATISRINSDEYAILFEDCNEKAAYAYANSIRRDIDHLRFRVDNRKYTVAASFGIIAIKPGLSISSTEILTCASKACYEAKRKGRNNIHIFNKHDNQFDSLREDAYWIPLIRDALENSRLKLLFQPVMTIHNNRIERFEALLRMVDTNNELISPDNFIAVAERNGLIQKIDLWVIGRAFDILAASARINRHFSLNINLSSHTFHESSLLPLVSRRLQQTTIDPARITFEITETAAVTSYRKGREILRRLRELGFKIALDDFGSGFNSLFHLKQLPIDYIKIDGGFITNLMSDQTDQTLVKSICEMSRKLGKETVAEFVLNRETLELLRSYGVDYAQGYYIGMPGDLDTFNVSHG
jgi:diguanylate cyclase (GGDEF)-like protein